jgi:hypothetical protein
VRHLSFFSSACNCAQPTPYSLAALHSWRFWAYFMRDSKPTPTLWARALYPPTKAETYTQPLDNPFKLHEINLNFFDFLSLSYVYNNQIIFVTIWPILLNYMESTYYRLLMPFLYIYI